MAKQRPAREPRGRRQRRRSGSEAEVFEPTSRYARARDRRRSPRPIPMEPRRTIAYVRRRFIPPLAEATAAGRAHLRRRASGSTPSPPATSATRRSSGGSATRTCVLEPDELEEVGRHRPRRVAAPIGRPDADRLSRNPADHAGSERPCRCRRRPVLLQALTDVDRHERRRRRRRLPAHAHAREERAARLRPARRRRARPDEPGDRSASCMGVRARGADRRRDHAPPAPAEQRAGPLDADRHRQATSRRCSTSRSATRSTRTSPTSSSSSQLIARLRAATASCRSRRRRRTSRSWSSASRGSTRPTSLHPAARAAQRLRLLRRAAHVRASTAPTSGRRSGAGCPQPALTMNMGARDEHRASLSFSNDALAPVGDQRHLRRADLQAPDPDPAAAVPADPAARRASPTPPLRTVQLREIGERERGAGSDRRRSQPSRRTPEPDRRRTARSTRSGTARSCARASWSACAARGRATTASTTSAASPTRCEPGEYTQSFTPQPRGHRRAPAGGGAVSANGTLLRQVPRRS